jgi:hypothetical protein
VRRGLYWLGVLLGVAALAGGAVIAALGIAATPGPDTIVRGYFQALADGDAHVALAYGTVPRGPHLLLTDDVLRDQQRIAPIRDVSVTSSRVRGERATVEVKYVLRFPHTDVPVSDRIQLHKTSGDWRLNRVAVATDLALAGGGQRLSVIGAQVPTGRMLLFPGALPIRTDTPYLQLDPFRDNITFDALSSTLVEVEVSDVGRDEMLSAVRARLRACLAGRAAPSCPLPTERFVPGSVHGSLTGDLRATIVSLGNDPVGTIRFSGSAEVHGSWTRLNFRNRRVHGHGTVQVQLHAIAYATQPLDMHWVVPS